MDSVGAFITSEKSSEVPSPQHQATTVLLFLSVDLPDLAIIEMGLYDIQSLCPASSLSVGFLRVIHVVMVSVLHSFYRQILVAFH